MKKIDLEERKSYKELKLFYYKENLKTYNSKKHKTKQDLFYIEEYKKLIKELETNLEKEEL